MGSGGAVLRGGGEEGASGGTKVSAPREEQCRSGACGGNESSAQSYVGHRWPIDGLLGWAVLGC